MPYRRLPNTDTTRLKALKTVIDNNSLYTVNNRIIDWAILNRLQPAYTRLSNAIRQYKANLEVQKKASFKIEPLEKKAIMYLSHFLRVLFMATDRNEIKPQKMDIYGLSASKRIIPKFNTPESVISWGHKIIEGEKLRIKQGGLPIYNPSIGKVATQLAVFEDAYNEQQLRIKQTYQAIDLLKKIRPEIDEIIFELWNQIEEHFANEPLETRYTECRKLGVTYYYRRHEEHLY